LKFFPEFFKDIPWQKTRKNIDGSQSNFLKTDKVKRRFWNYPNTIKNKSVLGEVVRILNYTNSHYRNFTDIDAVSKYLKPHIGNQANYIEEILRFVTLELFLNSTYGKKQYLENIMHVLNIKHIEPTAEENEILNRLDPEYLEYSEMVSCEREFLNALILRMKPKKVLEVGIAAGASSVCIANALKETGGELFSIDLSETYYKEPSKPSGFIINCYPELKAKCTQYLGGMACNFMDIIGDIDFAFIGTAHCFPGEVLDFLMIYPYLKPNAVVVFHDTSLNLSTSGLSKNKVLYRSAAVVTCMLCSAITGEKYQPNVTIPNITAIKFIPETNQRLWEVFNLLVHTWHYTLSDEDILLIANHFSRFYSEDAVSFFEHISSIQTTQKALFDTLKKKPAQPAKQNAPLYSQKPINEVNIPTEKITKLNYYRYRFLASITLGNIRKKYEAKRKAIKALIRKNRVNS
jgi:predicted O-methyltransferase YrrM